MTEKIILVVDDEQDILDLLKIALTRMGLKVITANDIPEAFKKIDTYKPHLVLSDLKLPSGDGFDILRKIQHDHPHIPTAVITAYGSTGLAVEAMKLGAVDFISKPVSLEKLRDLVVSVLNPHTTEPSQIDATLVGDSPSMQQLKIQIAKIAKSQAPVYIHGESGVGKEVVARLLHNQGSRRNGPFIAVNCGAIPAELMESEFFGHLKGSFTGASRDKSGLFSAADGGTLFLDEVAELPLNMQVKLLRAIQERSIRPVGAQKEHSVNVRILSATHRNLESEVSSGRFRQDLFYRINVIDLKAPPLRERGNDILKLSDHILKRLSNQLELPLALLSREAEKALLGYQFPGNVRELENILERALTLCDANEITTDDLALKPSRSVDQQDSIKIDCIDNLDDYLRDTELKIINMALEKANGNKTKAAKSLGITFRSMRYRLDRLGVE